MSDTTKLFSVIQALPEPEKFNVTIDISDDGLVKICSVNQEDGLKAKEYIHTLTADVTIGETYSGKIVKIMDFGAFVNLLPGKDGFLHISQIANERIQNIHDKLHEGQIITVKVVEIDKLNRVKLTMKNMAHDQAEKPTTHTGKTPRSPLHRGVGQAFLLHPHQSYYN